jgi:hypothetical protein
VAGRSCALAIQKRPFAATPPERHGGFKAAMLVPVY